MTVGFEEQYIPWKNLTDLTLQEFRLDNGTMVDNIQLIVSPLDDQDPNEVSF